MAQKFDAKKYTLIPLRIKKRWLRRLPGIGPRLAGNSRPRLLAHGSPAEWLQRREAIKGRAAGKGQASSSGSGGSSSVPPQQAPRSNIPPAALQQCLSHRRSQSQTAGGGTTPGQAACPRWDFDAEAHYFPKEKIRGLSRASSRSSSWRGGPPGRRVVHEEAEEEGALAGAAAARHAWESKKAAESPWW